MGKFEHAGLRVVAVALEVVATIGELVRSQALTDWAVEHWSDVMSRMDHAVNGPS